MDEDEDEPELMLPQDADGAPVDDELYGPSPAAPSPPLPFLSRWMQASWDWVQNAKYVISRRQMVTAAHLIQLQLNQAPCPVYILGKKYDPPPLAPAADGGPSLPNAIGRNLGLGLGSGEALIHSNPSVQEWHDTIAAEVESRVWCTYRTGMGWREDEREGRGTANQVEWSGMELLSHRLRLWASCGHLAHNRRRVGLHDPQRANALVPGIHHAGAGEGMEV